MSRDWTPIELYCVNEERKKQGLGSFEDISITYVINGEEIPSETDEFKEYKKQYKNLAFLYGDGMKKLVRKYGYKNNFLNNAFRKVENDLTDVISCVGNNQVKKNLNPIVKNWFLGKLDSGFYYNTENNRLFDEYIENQMREQDIGNSKIGGEKYEKDNK